MALSEPRSSITLQIFHLELLALVEILKCLNIGIRSKPTLLLLLIRALLILFAKNAIYFRKWFLSPIIFVVLLRPLKLLY